MVASGKMASVRLIISSKTASRITSTLGIGAGRIGRPSGAGQHLTRQKELFVLAMWQFMSGSVNVYLMVRLTLIDNDKVLSQYHLPITFDHNIISPHHSFII